MAHRIFEEAGVSARGNLLAFGEFRPFGGRELLPAYREETIRLGEKALEKPLPQPRASQYREFVTTGNRTHYEQPFFARRAQLANLVLAEAYERKGRFTEAAMDLLWAILEETSWVVPAHAGWGTRRPDDGLPCVWDPANGDWIDLFSAMTGALVAVSLYLIGGELDALSREVRARAEYELDRRLLAPFLARNDMWWMGEHGHVVNNWNPWILSNLLTVCALTEKDPARREAITDKAMYHANRFTEMYHDDGGCDEGPGYWGAAGACLFDFCEILRDMSGGKIDLFGNELVRRIGEYEAKVYIGGVWYLNFADSPPAIPDQLGANIARYGTDCASPVLAGFGARLVDRATREASAPAASLHGRGEEKTETAAVHRVEEWHAYRMLGNFTVPLPDVAPGAVFDRVWMDGIKVGAFRDGGFYLGLKGGTNGESHNHNDVGNFVVYQNGEPLIVDAGSDAYTAKTFSPQRYELWQNRSVYHNLPDFGGVEQQAGAEFRSRDEKTEGTTVSMDLASAYPAEAGLRSFRRTFVLRGGVTVTDEIALAQPTDVRFRFLFAVRPDLSGNTATVTAGGTACRFTFPAGLRAETEEIALSERMTQNWGRPFLYRLTLTAPAVTEGTFPFSLS